MAMTPFEHLLKFVLDATLWIAFVVVTVLLLVALCGVVFG